MSAAVDNPRKVLRQMLSAVWPHRLRIVVYVGVSFLLGAVSAGLLSLMNLLVKFLIDRRIPDEVGARLPEWTNHRLYWAAFTEGMANRQFLWLAIAAGVGLLFCKGVLQFLDRYLEGWLNARVILDTQAKVAAKMLELDFRFFQDSRHGEILSRLTNDMGALGRCIKIFCVALTRPLQLLFVVAWVVWMDWRLALLGFVALPLGVLGCAYLARRLRRIARKTQEKMADLTNVMVQFLSGMRIVKAYGGERFEAGNFEKENRLLFRLSVRREFTRALERPLSEFMTVTGSLAVLALGGYWVLDGQLDAAGLQIFFLAFVIMYTPAKELSRMYSDFHEAAPGVERVFALMERRPAMQGGARTRPPANWGLAFEKVDFAYVPGAPVLSELDMAIPAGRTLALVGRTGAGKSTIADLVLRLYDPDGGRILLGGVDLREYSLDRLRQGMALVSQDAFLFNGTIRGNIAYGVADADPERVVAAARAAYIHDEIMALPAGYDTLVGERGTSLSGGQRQRVAIARALFRDAPVLLLDEATSALDAESERTVQAALDKLLARADRTCLIIAHRLSTVRRADIIAVLEQGRIAAQGRHDELIKTCPAYANWIALQQ